MVRNGNLLEVKYELEKKNTHTQSRPADTEANIKCFQCKNPSMSKCNFPNQIGGAIVNPVTYLCHKQANIYIYIPEAFHVNLLQPPHRDVAREHNQTSALLRYRNHVPIKMHTRARLQESQQQ